jgi:GNAT superfamily N-acetyltransferase
MASDCRPVSRTCKRNRLYVLPSCTARQRGPAPQPVSCAARAPGDCLRHMPRGSICCWCALALLRAAHKPMIRYEQLGPNHGARLRSIRLRALQNAPEAFGTTYEEASAYGNDTWTRHVIELPTFVATDNDQDVAMVRCARDRHEPDTASLISMWVAPEVRRHHVGGTLVDLVVAWARSNGIHRLLLDVADVNSAAVALYAAKEFEPTGKVGRFPPPRQHIREHQRELRLISPVHRGRACAKTEASVASRDGGTPRAATTRDGSQ